MDWGTLIANRARDSGVLRVDDLTRELGVSEVAGGNALRREAVRGVVGHLLRG
jgi:hypothetical protein